MQIGFDTEKYLENQSKQILDRVKGKDKLYLEFGGKLVGDKHAKRVLPGFDEDAKMKLLQTIKDKVEIIICIYAGDIESNKVRGDYGIAYTDDVLRLIDEYHAYGIPVNSVLVTRYNQQPNAKAFMLNLKNRGIKVYHHEAIEGYPTDMDTIFGPNGFEKNAYIETTQPVVVVSAPGANSGKLSTCLSQIYHENKRGIKASYAKFETFPVWNLPLKHPVNVAYEAATVDINDANMIDSYHYDAYGKVAVNYNRDLNIFPVIRRILENILPEEDVYQSPTDMGVNCVADGIIDDAVCQAAAQQEIIRRYFAVHNDVKKGQLPEEAKNRIGIIMEESGLKATDRAVVTPARQYATEVQARFNDNEPAPVVALQLDDGRLVTGRSSDVMDATGAVIMNSLKVLAGINDEIDLLAPMILSAIQELKEDGLNEHTSTLTAHELLIALSISAFTNPTAKLAYSQLDKLQNTEAHATFIPTHENEQTLKQLGINITNDPTYANGKLYYN